MMMWKEYSDEELMQRIRAGGRDCMDVLIERYKGLVRGEARTFYLVGGDRDDLIQEGMLGLFKAIRDFKPEKNTSFATFAKLCIARQMYTAIQAAARQKHGPLNSYVEWTESLGDTEQMPLGKSPEELLLDQEAVVTLMGHIETLLSPMEYRIFRHYLDGKDYLQIAEMMGRSPKSVDNALQRIRRKIKKLLQDGNAPSGI